MRTATPRAPSGSFHPVTARAFCDELAKIAEVRPDAKESRAKLKRFMKGTAAVTAGAAAGSGTFMLADRAAHAIGHKTWSKLSPKARHAILVPLAALATGGGAYLMRKTLEDKHKYVEGR